MKLIKKIVAFIKKLFGIKDGVSATPGVPNKGSTDSNQAN